MEIYSRISTYLREGKACMVVTVTEKAGEGPLQVGKKMLVSEDGEAIGTVGGGAIEFEAREHCKRLLIECKSEVKKYLLSEGEVVEDAQTLPMACGGSASLFYEYIGAKAYVYIFGGGHVGQALAKVLRTMNFYLTVIDSREEVLNVFEGANRKIHGSFADVLDEEGIREGSYVIVCTPSHKYDYNVLDKIIGQKMQPKYMGMLCSRTKLADYLDRTYTTYGKDVDLSNFYSPIGLDIGGGSPAEIAISIAAEMLAVQNDKKTHKHMRGDY